MILIRVLPESLRYLKRRKGSEPQLRAILAEIGVPIAANQRLQMQPEIRLATSWLTTVLELLRPEFRGSTIIMWAGLFLNMLVLYLLGSWLPLMAHDAHFSLSQAALIGASMQIGGTLGNLAIGYAMDRWPPSLVVALFLFGAMATGIALSARGIDLTAIMLLISAMGFFTGAAVTGFVALSTLLYPPRIRATGTSMLTSLGRMGAVVGSSVGGVLMNRDLDFGQIFLVLSIPLAIAGTCSMLEYIRDCKHIKKPEQKVV